MQDALRNGRMAGQLRFRMSFQQPAYGWYWSGTVLANCSETNFGVVVAGHDLLYNRSEDQQDRDVS